MRFHGKVGFGETVEASPGVFVEEIVEFDGFGDVDQSFIKQESTETVNTDFSTSTMLRIMMSEEIQKRFSKMRYVEWEGVRWAVSSVDVRPPRLIVRLGEVYSGPAAGPPDTP